ncbi:heterokaryon incompatibility protein-domain-containing protein [Pyrenochaeta sp. MPI-SDFR-AT-0127]|nr:heterokaryon incompatibility protein-domain-containing protein [Pyrenochaeta sp. MPI-SDFR-AT-0127]
MASPEVPKQGINASIKKHFVQPFRSQKPKLKSSESATSSTSPAFADELIEALPTLQYGSLEPNKKSVRLLEIFPGPNYEPIRGSLRPCNLDDNPSYIALSYMWDQGSQHKYIECQGTKIRVGENLWNFLQQYRENMSTKQYHARDPVIAPRLWVDAVCINQADIDERGHQVSQMRDIYTGADSVIVWLGLAQGSEELAFVLTRYPSLLKPGEMSAALVDLLNKSYWSRVWVVQEFVLAKSVEIWCGSLRADAAAFESLCRSEQPLTGFSALSQHIGNSQGWPLFKYRRDFRHSRTYKRELLGRRNSKSLKSNFRLRDLLQSFATSQSSEVYDKVYGFLGIASSGRGERIRPDYTRTPVELLVDVLHNQCQSTTKRGEEDNYKFLAFLKSTLKVSRMDLAKHVLRNDSDIQQHIYVLAGSDFVVTSVSFVSTISDVGHFVDHAEAFQEGTWKTSWSRSSMHPRSLSNQDIQDLRPIALSPETAVVLSFADQHIPDAPYWGRSESIRQAVVSKSTEIVIQSIIKPTPEHASVGHNAISSIELQKLFSSSMAHAAELHLAAIKEHPGKDTKIRYERYATFVGTNGIIGLACIGGGAGTREVLTGDRICMFADTTESSNAFIVRLDNNGKWIIAGFAILLYPAIVAKPTFTPRPIQHTDTETTMIDNDNGSISRQQSSETDKSMCFHCHLTDLLELSRCGILNEAQMDRLLQQSLRGEPDDEIHQCSMGSGQCDILEFGLSW